MDPHVELLVIDDNPDLLEALVCVLRGYGYRVRYAPNGEAGLCAMREAPPDVVVTDVEMPILDGPGLVASMLAYDRGLERVPVVLVSGVGDLVGVASQVGTPYWLCKPFTVTRLLALIANALEERRAPIPSRGE